MSIEIKVLKGTIVKYNDHPIRLGQSITISVSDNEFKLEPHEILLDENKLERGSYIDDDNSEAKEKKI